MPDYIPTRDAEFDLWLDTFRNQLATRGISLGFTEEETAAFSSLADDWSDAFQDHLEAQQSARSLRRAKENARKLVTELARAHSRRLQAHPTITDSTRLEFGLTVSGTNAGPGPTAVPETRPIVSVNTAERLTTSSRRRPIGVAACEIWVKVGGVPPVDASELRFLTTATRSRYTAAYDGDEAGQPAHYMLRWIGTRGQRGPWSQTITATIPV